jgi:DNA polymerase family B
MKDGRSSGIIYNRGKSHHQTGTHRFVCVDGEGIRVGSEHRYVLLGIGHDQIENENGLEWHEILEFLYSHYQKGTAYCGFYLGYDFDRWLRTMPMKKVERLLTNEGRESRKSKSENLHGRVLPVDLPRGWQINMLGKKMLEFRKRICHCDIVYCSHPKGPWMRICDAGAFFQTSFLNVIDPKNWDQPILSQDEYESIKKGKENRATADCITDEMRYYNRLENEILARVMNLLDLGFRKMGIVLAPGQWFGPGQAAQKWMKNHDVPPAITILDSVPQWFLEAARMSYFGGWFEIMLHGIIPGESYEYDINSAYPYIISALPCLLHGNWQRGNGTYRKYKNNAKIEYVLVYARVSCYRKGNAAYIGTMLHRDRSDRIFRPTRTEGWFWLHEIEAAKRAQTINQCHIKQWMRYIPCDCPPPLRDVKDLYDLRLEVGKNTPLGKGCKLAYNSMYGKFAQSIGHPMFANPVYASLITAGCRTMILNAIATHPGGKWNVCMVATDAVFFLDPHPGLQIGNGLGEWDYKARNNLTLFKPGVYWDDSTRIAIAENRLPVFKARGISARAFANSIHEIDAIFSIWSDNPPDLSDNPREVYGWPTVKFKSGFSMVSCLQAIRRGKWWLAGHVDDEREMTQNANPYDKRIGAYAYNHNGRIIWRSEPWTLPLDDCRSKPYTKRFGMEDPWSLDRKELYGITPDGTVPDLISEVLGMR